MDYKVKLIRKNEQSTSRWSGGTTTQLAIYPEDSEYAMRNFKWRLSSARVDLEESMFTNLPGIKRLIMTIDGEMKLEHEGHYKALLKPFEQDSFMGDWTTRSFGKVRDFNLMLSDGIEGAIEGINLKNEFKNFTYKYDKQGKVFEAFYSAHGSSIIKIEGEGIFELGNGDFILIEILNPDRPLCIEMKSIDGAGSDIIRASIIC